ncbi:hypothetical protein [Pseudoalteromonas prydzensis]|uniref:hypothetical protein n=1 Tax=Pseudoalteromonas prydzensis TaxID=182141 RepID=UPI003FD33A59
MVALKKQIGATVPSYAAILLMVAAGAWYAIESTQTTIIEQQNNLVSSMRGQVLQRINAMQSCYNDLRDWCIANKLRDYGLTEGALNNSFVVDQVANGENISLTVQAPNRKIAEAFSRHVKNPVVNGPQVTFLVEPPTSSQILTNQIQRYSDGTGHNRNSLATDILMDGKDLNNFDTAKGESGEFNQLNADRQETKTLKINRQLKLGVNEITFDGQKLHINAQRTNLLGSVNIDGDVDVNNNDVTGFNNVTSNHLDSENIAASTGVISSLKGTNIQYDTAKIDQLSAYKYTSSVYTADDIEAVSLNADHINSNVESVTGNIADLNFSTASGQDWNYNSSDVNHLSSQSSSLGDASGKSLLLTNDLRGNAMYYSLGRFTSVNVLGLTTGSQFSASGDFVTSTSSVNQNNSTLSTHSASISRNVGDITTTKNQIGLTRDKISANTTGLTNNQLDIATNATAINSNQTKVANNAGDIDGVASRLSNSAEQLELWQDRLDKCMYQTQYCIPQDPTLSLTCSDCTQAKPQSSFSATASATISACRQGCSYSWVVSSTFSKMSGTCLSGTIAKGGSATPTCKITKSTISPQQTETGEIRINVQNSHYTDRSDSKYVNVSFKNTTVPRPIVNTSCSGCEYTGMASSVSALVSSTITNCPQGCSYSWSISGGASESCPSGSVSAGGSAAPSCSISGNVSEASTMTGSVSLVVKNSVSPSYSDQDSRSYRWENTTPNDPFKSVFAGCYVDTVGFDSVNRNSCYNDGFRSQGQPGRIVFSVGNRTMNTESYYFSSDINASISWSGDCSGTSNMCSIVKQCFGSSCPANGVKSATAHVTINGVTKAFTVIGSDLSRVSNGTEPR